MRIVRSFSPIIFRPALIPYRWVSTLLGLLLLTAAGLKIYGWSVSTVPPVGQFSSSEVQAAAIGWEMLLGVWLLCGTAAFGSWLAALGTFTLLAAISGYLGAIGQARCGCFGRIEASPWHAFAVDVAALLLLAVARPNRQGADTLSRVSMWRSASPAGYFILGVSAIIASATGIGAWVYGSPEAALARLRGEALTVDRGFIDCGAGKPGETLEASIVVRNWTDHPVRIYGGTSDCSCVATKGLPLTIPAGGAAVVPVRMRVPQSVPGAFTRRAELITDCKEQPVIRLRLGCHVE